EHEVVARHATVAKVASLASLSPSVGMISPRCGSMPGPSTTNTDAKRLLRLSMERRSESFTSRTMLCHDPGDCSPSHVDIDLRDGPDRGRAESQRRSKGAPLRRSNTRAPYNHA